VENLILKEPLPVTEQLLSSRDHVLAEVIDHQTCRWPSEPTEDPIWGLVRIVIAQQVTTKVACGLSRQLQSAFPHLACGSITPIPDVAYLRSIGLPERRAQCCVDVIQRSTSILAAIKAGDSWEQAIASIKGIGPWTISVFRIMVLRELDVLPLRDVGLERAVGAFYGRNVDLEELGELWRPYRSVACWYLWRTLGNEQLG
jgi:DNA-3-methyladenine glycosylase II